MSFRSDSDSFHQPQFKRDTSTMLTRRLGLAAALCVTYLSLATSASDVADLTKALAPEYEVAATELKPSKIALAKVDCTVETALCEEHGVKGYPTLKVFKNKNAMDYAGQRKADSIVSYMKKLARPAVTELTADKVAAFSADDKVVIIGFFANTTSEYKSFQNVAAKLSEKFSFGVCSDPAAKKEYGDASVVLFKKFDEGKNLYTDTITESGLESFIGSNSVPLMDDIGPENYASYVESGKPLAYFFTATDDQKASWIESIAKEFKADINFVYIDAVKFGGHAKNLNLKEDWPAFAIQRPAEGTKYPMDQSKPVDEASVRAFVTDFVKGNVAPSMKSEPEPESNDGPVKIIVGTNYEKIVMDASKDVFLELYAPWCGHCKKLAPIWDELGSTLATTAPGIIIAKMDATENDLPVTAGYQVQGFPTLKLIKANSNEVLDYSGDRSLEAFLRFLKENASNGSEVGGAAKAAAAAEGSSEGSSEGDDSGPDRDEL
ncbi:hypothetical protein SmJEL517_g03369 [Synchytrium microbalum]|uniref:Protein disulfide-isomerase n=1 Tax=Synchytrium microbalum TaxID=1806994 RepID=A0A507BYP2_9FUNG|nr:uncharacterized protein SmJEL517_g03369 [Synchytrium microbalum]TPX33927.1 hypothetical protein SmJEL517_g03369 [Synchytrium microbalum]